MYAKESTTMTNSQVLHKINGKRLFKLKLENKSLVETSFSKQNLMMRFGGNWSNSIKPSFPNTSSLTGTLSRTGASHQNVMH